MRRTNNQESGLSLLEVVCVLGLMGTLLSFSIFRGMSTIYSYKANAAQDLVLSAFRQARLISITQRRDVQVWIVQAPTGPGQVQSINYQVVPAGNEPQQQPVSFLLPQGTQMVLETGVPDTPMAFGNSAPVYIGNVPGGPPIMEFHPTGEFTDSNNSLLNGSVFIGVPGQSSTARAVTILGGIGCVDHFTWTGTHWQ